MTQSSTDSSLVARTESEAWLVGYIEDLKRTPNRFAAEICELEAVLHWLRSPASRISTLERELEEVRAGVKEMTEAANSYAHQAAKAAIALTAAEAKVARMGEALPSDDKWQLLLSAAEKLRGGSSDPERKVEAAWRIAYELAKWAAQIDAARFALQKDREGEDGR